jgi:hypothetical protein
MANTPSQNASSLELVFNSVIVHFLLLIKFIIIRR